jgi:PAS domain S-box-containing protein
MKNIHVSTTIGLVLNIASIVLIYLGLDYVAGGLLIIAYLASMKEVSKYTSWYQFSNVFSAAILLGYSIDFGAGHATLPLFAGVMFLSAFGSIFRIVYFKVFGYTGYSWFEPTFFFLSLAGYFILNITGHYGWAGWVYPAPLLVFAAILAWGILKDKKQLLAHTQGGYRVKLGQPASDFALPDQDGTTIKLSDFRGKRHLLLIFVRGDWCPGCHMMLRTYMKNNAKFQEKNILVMAIGPDPVGVNRGMVEKLGLDFKVLADQGQRTAMEYGVQLKEYENDFAEKYEEGIPLPASFLIDINSTVRYVSRPDKVGEFLNPSLIFPIIEQLDGKYVKNKEETEAPVKEKPKAVTGSAESEIEALKKQLRNYESVIDQANDSMIVIDIVNGKIHQSNPSIEKLLGYSKEELEKLTLFDLHPPEYLQQSSSIVADTWEKGGLIYQNIPFKTRSGELIPVECSAKVAPFDGRPAIVIYARDITERLRMERKINEQRKMIEERNKDIEDSIEYSKRIQRSILIEMEQMQTYAPESFILFKPKDIVSGDFYWFTGFRVEEDITEENSFGYKAGDNVLLVAAVDCTGHGVPGAFMSIIGNSLLNQTLNNLHVTSAAHALDYVNVELKKSLNKNSAETPLKDGMDIALCCIDFTAMHLEFAGANNPLYIVRDKELIEFKADKQPISASGEIVPRPFTNQKWELKKGDTIYLFTDGYADQFGGEHLEGGRAGGKKFLYKRFKELLVSMQELPMQTQKEKLFQIFEEWRGKLEQVDDVLVIGIRI